MRASTWLKKADAAPSLKLKSTKYPCFFVDGDNVHTTSYRKFSLCMAALMTNTRVWGYILTLWGKQDQALPTARLCFPPFIHVFVQPHFPGAPASSFRIPKNRKHDIWAVYMIWTPRSLFPSLCLCFLIFITWAYNAFTVQKEKADVHSDTQIMHIFSCSTEENCVQVTR